MKVLVLATDELKAELLARPVNKDVDLQWLSELPVSPDYRDAGVCIDLLFEPAEERINWLRQLKMPLIIVNSVITPLKEIGADFIRINGGKTFLSRGIIEAACMNESLKMATERLFSALGRNTEWVPDIKGFITPRIVASIINEAFLGLEEKISVETEIDIAMKLGTNYPYGPFEWGQKIGLHDVYSLLEALSKEQTRYKPSALLKERILV
jgi:3-hydroxybutyryl-CoA dehydrogenase